MANPSPFTWKPTDVVEVTNSSSENLLLALPSGLLRLDRGRSLRLTASALAQPDIKTLAESGKLQVKTLRRK